MTRHNINQDVELNDKINEEGPGELGQRPRRLPSGLLDCEVHLVSSRTIDASISVSRQGKKRPAMRICDVDLDEQDVALLKHIIESKHKLASVKDARGQGYTKDVLEAMMASTTEGVNLRRVADRLKEKSRWEQKLRDIKGRLFPDGCLHEQEAKKRREEEAERANAVRGADVANKLGIPSASADWPDIRHYLNDFFQISKKVVENNGMWWISSGDMKEEVVCVAERIKHWSEQHRDKRTELFKVLTNLRVALRNGVQCDIIIT